MRVHHLNCGTMRPRATPDALVCHVLLIETESGLVLVDSGFGLRDSADPRGRFGPARFFVRPDLNDDESAIRQIEALGLDARDVHNIVLTHFDADHTGGLADFPWAKVHLTAAEKDAAWHPRTRVEKGRYLPAQRDHDPVLVEHTPASSEAWRGFPGAKELTEIAPGIVLINLPGHSRGHAAVAVDAGEQWILHVGDAFYYHGQLDGTKSAPRAVTVMERLIAYDWTKVQDNHRRLSELWQAPEPDLMLINAHDPTLYRNATKPNAG